MFTFDLMIDEFLELLELQLGIRAGVESCFPNRLWVKAEIASVQIKTNGHCYLDLCQNEGGTMVARAKAVVWRSRYQVLAPYLTAALGGPLKAGMQILCRAQVSYSELYSLSLVIDEIEPCLTLGEAEMEKRRTIERLEAEGLTNRQKSLEIPLLPSRLAVISAPDAAGFGDFQRHLEDNVYGFSFEVKLFPATMQGASAPESIVDAIESVETSEQQWDAILIMRGGGSVPDLACFDDYSLTKAIALCHIPVFTAIGHEKDYHVADMVAHSFVKTPTALADEFIDAFASEDERICGYGRRLRLSFLSRISAMEAKVENLYTRILSADPRAILSRGYVLVSDASGRVAKSVSVFSKGDSISIIFPDGKLSAVVQNLF